MFTFESEFVAKCNCMMPYADTKLLVNSLTRIKIKRVYSKHACGHSVLLPMEVFHWNCFYLTLFFHIDKVVFFSLTQHGFNRLYVASLKCKTENARPVYELKILLSLSLVTVATEIWSGETLDKVHVLIACCLQQRDRGVTGLYAKLLQR